MLLRLTALTRSQLSSVVSTAPPTSKMPTLLYSTSTRPKVSMQCPTIAFTSASSETSARNVTQVPPSPAMIRRVSSAAPGSISTARTLARSRANRTAAALPVPHPGPAVPAPVTIATLSFRRFSMIRLTMIEVRYYRVSQPPSTGNAAPVMPAAPSPHRNTASAATCSTVTYLSRRVLLGHVLGGQGLQDGKVDAAGRSGDDGGFSLQHLGASSGVPCPESAFQCLLIHAFAFIHVHVHYARTENRPPAVHG